MSSVAKALARVALFEPLSDRQLERLASGFLELRLAPGDTAYAVADPSDGFYVVREGVLLMLRGREDEAIEALDRLGPGDFFGEIGLFDGLARTECVRAEEPSAVLRIGRDPFLDFLETEAGIALKLQLAAARGHSTKVGLGLKIAQRRAPRHRLRREIRLEERERPACRALLVDLSRLGACLAGVPEDWQKDRRVRCEASWGRTTLALAGKIVWRRGDAVGIAFEGDSPARDRAIRHALEQLIAGDPTAAPA